MAETESYYVANQNAVYRVHETEIYLFFNCPHWHLTDTRWKHSYWFWVFPGVRHFHYLYHTFWTEVSLKKTTLETIVQTKDKIRRQNQPKIAESEGTHYPKLSLQSAFLSNWLDCVVDTKTALTKFATKMLIWHENKSLSCMVMWHQTKKCWKNDWTQAKQVQSTS